MDEVRSASPTRKRTVLRRIVPERLADFDEQVWPVNLAILVFAGFVTGVVLATAEDFFDPRPFYNGFVRLGLIALLVVILLWSTSRVRAPTARRIQFCVILSLFLHMVLAVLLREQYLKLIAYIRERQASLLSDAETSLSLPDYPDTVENAGTLGEYTRPLQEVTTLASPRPQAPSPQFDSATNAPPLPPGAEERSVVRDRPQPMVPARPLEERREATKTPVKSEERRPTPGPEELAASAALEEPPRQSAPSQENNPRDNLQPQTSLPGQLPQAGIPDHQPSVAVNAPPRVTVEPPLTPGRSPPPVRQLTPSGELSATQPEERLTAPASPGPPVRDLHPGEEGPRRSEIAMALPRPSISERLLLPDARVPETRPPLRPDRPDTISGIPASSRRQSPLGSEPTGLTGSAEVAPIPATTAPKVTPQPERSVAVRGPDTAPMFPMGASTRLNLVEPGDLPSRIPSATPRSRRPSEVVDSEFAGVASPKAPGSSAPRDPISGPISGSVANITPPEEASSGNGAANSVTMERGLEPRSDTGTASTMERWMESGGGIGQLGSEAGATSASELTQGLGTAFSPIGGGLENGVREGGLFTGVGTPRDTGAAIGGGTTALTGSLLAGPVPLENHGGGAGESRTRGGTPPERPGSADLGYPTGPSLELEIPPGYREAQLGMISAPAGSSDGAGTGDGGNIGQAGGLLAGPGTWGTIAPRLPGAGPGFRDRDFSVNVSSAGSLDGIASGRRNGGTQGTIASAVPLEPGSPGGSGGLRSSPGGTPGERTSLEPTHVTGSLPLLPFGGSGTAGEGSVSATSRSVPPRVFAGEGGGRLEIGQIGTVKAAARTTTGTGSPQALPGRADMRPSEAFARRNPTQRSAHAAQFGGSPETEQAVECGLAFLARIQFPDGHWSLHRLPDHVPDPLKSFHLGTMHGDTAATALSLLAFLGAGYTHQEEKYRDTVNRALRWVIQNQLSDGRFFREQTDSDLYTRFYGHGLATIALCEAYGMTRDPALREPAERGIAFIVRAQSPEFGGWRYTPRKETDTSVTGWQLMALKSAQMAGLEVPQTTLEGVSRWLDRAQAEGGAKYVYSPYVGAASAAAHLKIPNRAMTAEGLLMRIYLGWGPDHPALQKGAAFLAQNLPSYGDSQNPLRDAYYWYYATQVMFQMQGEAWKSWNERIQKTLLPEQVQSGPWAGSWDPLRSVPDRWGKEAGRLYVTAMHLLILEVYYRHLPLFRSLAQNP